MANEFVARNGLIAQANSQITGSLIVSNGITADLTGTASYASNANLLDGLDSTQFTSTSSFNAYTASVNNNSGSFVTYTNFNANTSSINNFSASILSYTSSINSATSSFVLNSQTSSFVQNSQTSSFVQNSQTGAFVQNSQTGAFATFTVLNDYTSSTNNFSASILSYTASQNNLNGTYATTGSNIFKGTQVLSGLDPSGPSPSLLRLSGSNGQNAIQFYSGSAQLGNIVNIDDRLIISNPHSVAKGITLLTNITGGIELNTEEVFIHNVLRVSGSTLIGTDTLTPTANEKLLIDAENLNSYNLITARSNVNNYSQFNINNKSSGSNASTDVVATNDIGTESTYFVDLGINSSQFADQIGGPNDAYLYTTGSNLLISNLTNDKDISLSTIGNGKINATGSVIVTGSLSLNGSNVVLTNQTSSFVQNSQTSSFVQNSQTSSMSVLSASYAATASFAENFTVANTLTAQTLVVQTVTSSVIYSSGSNVFGNSLANTQVLTGSVIVTGSLSVNGSNAVLTNQTSSFVQNSQTSSFVQNSQTGAFATFTALNAYTSSIDSYTSSLNSATSSFVLNSQTSSLATFTALNAYTSSINSYTSSLNSATSSFVRNSQTSSMTVLSASFASTASKISILNDVDTRILTANGDGTISAEGNLQFDGNTLKVLYQAGDEGGEILLNKPVTNTSISGSGVLIDVYQNKLRFFEQGAPNRGAYIDITAAASSVGTNLLAGGGGGSTDTGSLATTGSNLFRGNQIISGSLTVTSSIYQGFFASNETQLTGYGVVVQGANARLRVGPNYTTGGDRDYIDLIPGSTNSRITTNNENLSLENRESNGNISLITSGSGNVNVTGSLNVIGSSTLNGNTNLTGSLFIAGGNNSISTSIWEKLKLVTAGVTAPARQGSDANGLNFTTNALWAPGWVQDDSTKKSFAYIQHLGNGRHEFRTSPSGGTISYTTSLTIDESNVNINVPTNIIATTNITGSLIVTGSSTITGNVGIGTTSPAVPLDVVSNSTANGINLRTRVNDDYGFLNFKSYNASEILSEIYVHRTAANVASLIFTTNNGTSSTERMRITSSGNVGIGTTSPIDKLTVSGRINVLGTSQNSIWLNQTAGGSSSGYIVGRSFSSDDAQNFFIYDALAAAFRLSINSTGNVGIGTTSPGYKLDVNGDTNITGTLTATVKSFIIDHPTKPGKKLQYGVLEGPEHSVYVRGKLTNGNTITLPDHWYALVHEDTITVNLTPIGKKQDLWVESVTDKIITISSEEENINCYYTVFAERKDIDKLIIEFDIEE